VAGPGTLIAENPFAFATYGGVGGGFIRSQPGTSGTVTVTATHPTLGQASGSLVIAPATEAKFDSGAPVTASPTPPTTSPGPPTPAAPPQAATPRRPATPPGPSKAEVKAALAAVLSPRGAQARIAKLLHHAGYTFTFDAPSTGKLVIDWYYVTKPARTSNNPKPRKVLIASASQSIKKAGQTKVNVKLTPRGRSLLKHANRPRLTVQARFTPIGESTTTSSKIIALRR
jgi:hypothetical protein